MIRSSTLFVGIAFIGALSACKSSSDSATEPEHQLSPTEFSYGDRVVDALGFLGIGDWYVRMAIDPATKDIYWTRSAMRGVELVKIPYAGGTWDESGTTLIANLGERSIWNLKYDLLSQSVLFVSDDTNNARWNVYRVNPVSGLVAQVTDVDWTIGYAIDPISGAIISNGQTEPDFVGCLYEAWVDGFGQTALACDTPEMPMSIFEYPEVDATGARVALTFQTNNDRTQQQLGLFRRSTGEFEILTNTAEGHNRASPIVWHEDKLYFVMSDADGATESLYAYDDQTRTIGLVRQGHTAIGSAAQMDLSAPAATTIVLADATAEGVPALVVFDLVHETEIATIDASAFFISNSVDFSGMATDGVFFAAAERMDRPSRYVMALDPRITNPVNMAYTAFDPAADRALVESCPAEIIEYTTFDLDTDSSPRKISAVLQHPPFAVAQPAAIVWAHGGPGEEAMLNFDADREFFCHLGYTVLTPNYRGSTGRGADFENLNNGDWCNGDYLDLEYGRRYLVDSLGITEGRIGIAGHSHGGYMTNCALTKPDNRFAFGITSAGSGDLLTQLQDTVIPDLLTTEMGDPSGNPDIEALYRDRSPITHAENLAVPLLMIHGDKDGNVPFSCEKTFYDRLVELGKGDLVTLVVLEDIGHFFFDIGPSVTRFQAMADISDRVVPVSQAQ